MTDAHTPRRWPGHERRLDVSEAVMRVAIGSLLPRRINH